MITINNLEFENIKRFVLFEIYYQEMMSIDLNDNLIDIINKLMDYHMNEIYGDSKEDVIDSKFQSIVSYNE